MARLPRIFYPGIAQHIIQCGNDRHVCFVTDEDFVAYAHRLEKYSNQYDVAVHAWVYMTNHINFEYKKNFGSLLILWVNYYSITHLYYYCQKNI